MRTEEEKSPRGVQALESSGVLLDAIVRAQKPISLRDLATVAGMPPAKAFPHLVSLVKSGLLQRDEQANYSVGTFALELGLLGLQRLSPAQEAAVEIRQITQKTGLTVATAVLGPLGPVVIQLEESDRPVHISLRLGTVLSLANTTMGRVFAAHLPETQLAQMLEQEVWRMSGSEKRTDTPAFRKRLCAIRERGIDNAQGKPVPGVHALAAPVFDHAGDVALVLALIGAAGMFDSNLDGDVAKYLMERCRQLSNRLGCPLV